MSIDNFYTKETVYDRPQEEWEGALTITIRNLIVRQDAMSLITTWGSFLISTKGKKFKFSEESVMVFIRARDYLREEGYMTDWVNEDPREWVTKPNGDKLW